VPLPDVASAMTPEQTKKIEKNVATTNNNYEPMQLM